MGGAALILVLTVDFQTVLHIIVEKGLNQSGIAQDYFGQKSSRAIARAQPDNFRWCAVLEQKVVKVFVLCDNGRKTLLPRRHKNMIIIGIRQTERLDVSYLGKNTDDALYQSKGDILVNEDFHGSRLCNNCSALLAHSGEFECGYQVLFREFREIGQDILKRHI